MRWAQVLMLQIIRAIKLPPNEKKKKKKKKKMTGKKRLKGHGPGHTMHLVTYYNLKNSHYT